MQQQETQMEQLRKKVSLLMTYNVKMNANGKCKTRRDALKSLVSHEYDCPHTKAHSCGKSISDKGRNKEMPQNPNVSVAALLKTLQVFDLCRS